MVREVDLNENLLQLNLNMQTSLEQPKPFLVPMLSFFKKSSINSLEKNKLFKVVKKTEIATIYEMEDAPVSVTKVKTKRLQKETSKRKEIIGQSEIILLGLIPIASIAQTKEVEDTVETAKFYVEESPAMQDILSQITNKLKGKEVLKPGRLYGSLTQEQEEHEFHVIPYIYETKDNFVLGWTLV